MQTCSPPPEQSVDLSADPSAMLVDGTAAARRSAALEMMKQKREMRGTGSTIRYKQRAAAERARDHHGCDARVGSEGRGAESARGPSVWPVTCVDLRRACARLRAPLAHPPGLNPALLFLRQIASPQKAIMGGRSSGTGFGIPQAFVGGVKSDASGDRALTEPEGGDGVARGAREADDDDDEMEGDDPDDDSEEKGRPASGGSGPSS